jgi:hypothetical protein
MKAKHLFEVDKGVHEVGVRGEQWEVVLAYMDGCWRFSRVRDRSAQ